jgi:hypothetical protein
MTRERCLLVLEAAAAVPGLQLGVANHTTALADSETTKASL